MKIVCVSDTHSQEHLIKVPDGDILLHTGDLLGWGTKEEAEKFNYWLGTLPHKYKIVVAGNHDKFIYESPREEIDRVLSNAIYLEDDLVEVEGLKIYGSPYTPIFFNWYFMLNDEGLKKKWEEIPEGIDILMTHGPPEYVLDYSIYGRINVGCKFLAEKVKKIKPKYHIFGHIHFCNGFKQIGNTTYINAAICNEQYKPIQRPIVFEV